MVVLQDTGRTTLGISIAMSLFTIVVITLRFVAKWKGNVKYRLEDVLILLAFATFAAYMGCFLKDCSPFFDESQALLPRDVNAEQHSSVLVAHWMNLSSMFLS